MAHFPVTTSPEPKTLLPVTADVFPYGNEVEVGHTHNFSVSLEVAVSLSIGPLADLLAPVWTVPSLASHAR